MANKRYIYLINNLHKLNIHDGVVIDCGCGEGIGSKYLINNGFKVHSFDLSDDAIDKCRKNGVDAKKEDITNLLIEDNFADIFICSETLEHLDRGQSSMAVIEIKRVCKKDGIICITVPENKNICLEGNGHKQYLSRDDLVSCFFELEIIFEGIFCKKMGRCNRVIFFKNIGVT